MKRRNKLAIYCLLLLGIRNAHAIDPKLWRNLNTAKNNFTTLQDFDAYTTKIAPALQSTIQAALKVIEQSNEKAKLTNINANLVALNDFIAKSLHESVQEHVSNIVGLIHNYTQNPDNEDIISQITQKLNSLENSTKNLPTELAATLNGIIIRIKIIASQAQSIQNKEIKNIIAKLESYADIDVNNLLKKIPENFAAFNAQINNFAKAIQPYFLAFQWESRVQPDWADRFKRFFSDAGSSIKDTFQGPVKDFFVKDLYEEGLKHATLEALVRVAEHSLIPAVTMLSYVIKGFALEGNDWFGSNITPEYCDISPSKNIQIKYDAQKEKNREKEYTDPQSSKYDPLYTLIKKYTPVFYLQSDEKFLPIRAEEFFFGGNSQLVRDTGEVALAKENTNGKNFWQTFTKERTDKKSDYTLYNMYWDIDDCIKFGSNPALNKDTNGVLKTPVYVVASEQKNKLYIQYGTFYGFNAPYDIGPLTGNKAEFQNAHESDLEHITLEFDKNSQKLLRIYYGSHGTREGMWLDANNPDIEWIDGTHPVAYSARGGHGIYPRAGTYIRIWGIANDVTNKGYRWEPELIMVYPETDKRFDPKTMSWLYNAGKYGKHGVNAYAYQDWFMNAPYGDVGRDYDSVPFCKSGKWQEFCIIGKIPDARPPGLLSDD